MRIKINKQVPTCHKKARSNLFLLIYIIGVLFFISTASGRAQKLAIETNLVHWATLTPNIGVELATNNKISLKLSGGYNPWTFLPDYTSLRHYIAQPEIRFWFKQPFKGHLLGIHGIYSKYNIGHISFIPALKNNAYKGNDYGGGLTYGYQFGLGKRWRLEFLIGGGYLYRVYDKYLCVTCEERLESVKEHYIGVTKAGISLLYVFP